MPGGFGNTPWGGGPWGGAGADFEAEFDAPETVTISEGLTVSLPLKLLTAVALNITLVELTFSHPLDNTYNPPTSPANYTILPTLQVLSASYGPGPNKIRLQTEHQAPDFYTVTVGTARSTGSDIIEPAFRSANFVGFEAAPTFFASVQGPRKVMLSFSQPMTQDSAFTDPANYVVKDLNGNTIPVIAAVATGNVPISYVTLTLGSDLRKWGYFVVTVDSDVQTATSLSLAPDTNLFQWTDNSAAQSRGPIVIPIQNFSGEVSGGLHGIPAGQIFFSPALSTAAPNSVLQVEEVSVCTRAFDVYEPPSIPDPTPFFTYGNPAAAGSIGSLATVLWAPAPRLGQARVQLTDTRADTLPAMADSMALFALREPINTSVGGFLNDARWHVYDGTPTTFTVADNSVPVGPGPTQITVSPGDSVLTPDTLLTITNYVRSMGDAVVVVDGVSLTQTKTISDIVGVTEQLVVTSAFFPEFDEFDPDEFEPGDFE